MADPAMEEQGGPDHRDAPFLDRVVLRDVPASFKDFQTMVIAIGIAIGRSFDLAFVGGHELQELLGRHIR